MGNMRHLITPVLAAAFDPKRTEVKDSRGNERQREDDEVQNPGPFPIPNRKVRPWKKQQTEHSNQKISKISRQVRRRLELGAERQRAPPDPGKHFYQGLDGAFRPAMLLRLVSGHGHRQLRRRHDRACDQVTSRQERAPSKEGGGNEQGVGMAHEAPQDVRHDETDEPDRSHRAADRAR